MTKWILAAMAVFMPTMALAQEAAISLTSAQPMLNAANTCWVLVSAALVMLMTPGLAFFYAGMVSFRNVVSTLLQSYASLALVGLIWVACGYSLAFTAGNGFIGGFSQSFFNGLSGAVQEGTGIPMMAFAGFQMMFAVITPALITGSCAERVRFKPWLFIMGLWSLCVYIPVAHWVWGGGYLAQLGALDFAGGLVVHITAGMSGLIVALMYGKRDARDHSAPPNDVTMIMLGAALLFFGWFGFNAGSALAANGLAAHAFVTTFVGGAGAFIAWMIVDWIRDGRPTAVGGAMGIVAGLVAITPAAGYVDIAGAMIVAFASGIICNMAGKLIKNVAHLDDALDVFSCHGLGGIVGAILTGVFATSAVNPAVTTQGVAISGEWGLFLANLGSVAVVCAYSCFVTFVIVQCVKLFMPIRATAEEEHAGLDHSIHGERAKHRD